MTKLELENAINKGLNVYCISHNLDSTCEAVYYQLDKKENKIKNNFLYYYYKNIEIEIADIKEIFFNEEEAYKYMLNKDNIVIERIGDKIKIYENIQ